MSYVPDATQKTEPQDSQKASTAALEFRTLKAYVQDVVLPLIATKFGPAGGILLGQIVSTNSVPLRIHNDNSRIDAYANDGTTSIGSLIFGNGAWTAISAGTPSPGVLLAKAGESVNFDGAVFYSSDHHDLGSIPNRWGVLWGIGANFSGNVDAAAFSGDGSALTNLPASTLTGAAIISALGYTPYNAANPANYQTPSGSVALAGGATLAGFSEKTGTVSSDADESGTPMHFLYVAGSGAQPSWVWGANDITTHKLWNPAGFSVAHATTSGSALRAAQADRITDAASNGFGKRTVSTSDPSGGADGDIWFKV